MAAGGNRGGNRDDDAWVQIPWAWSSHLSAHCQDPCTPFQGAPPRLLVVGGGQRGTLTRMPGATPAGLSPFSALMGLLPWDCAGHRCPGTSRFPGSRLAAPGAGRSWISENLLAINIWLYLCAPAPCLRSSAGEPVDHDRDFGFT